MIEEYEKWNTNGIHRAPQTLYVDNERKISQVSSVISYNVDNSEMILGRALNIRADEVMQAPKNF